MRFNFKKPSMGGVWIFFQLPNLSIPFKLLVVFFSNIPLFGTSEGLFDTCRHKPIYMHCFSIGGLQGLHTIMDLSLLG